MMPGRVRVLMEKSRKYDTCFLKWYSESRLVKRGCLCSLPEYKG